MEWDRKGFDEAGARNGLIARREPSGVQNQKRSASHSILMGPTRYRQLTVEVACGRRERGYLKGRGLWSPRYTRGEGVNSCKSVNKMLFAIDIANARVLPSTSISQSPLHPPQPPIPSYQHTEVGGCTHVAGRLLQLAGLPA
jgi:hypothetical protein